MKLRTLLAAVILLFTFPVQAGVYSPRVLSPHNADTYSLKTFAEFPRWRDLQGDAKVYEIFKYLIDRRTGIYPMGVPAWEGRDEMSEFGVVRDPVKMLNVYPIGHCGTLGPTMAGIMQGMGIGPARTLILPAWNHVASEVFYDGKWHYLDLDVRAIFRRSDGSLASMEEAQRDASLWRRPNGPEFFPLDPLDQVRQVYAKTPVHHYYGYGSGGHTMDYVLRPGETFTRWWKPQGGRWNHHPSYGERPFPRSVIDQEPRGPKSKHPSFTVHTHGNGRFVYQPNLTDGSSDFQDGVYDARNVRTSASGLTLQESGEGYVIFEVRSPYVIVPLVGDPDTAADDRDASNVKTDAAGATLLISLDNGLTWKSLAAGTGGIDLTTLVSGTYGYLLKIILRGEPGKAVMRSLVITTWVQLHPAALPSLRQGRNEMRLVSGDHYGLPSRVTEIRSAAGQPEEFLKYLVETPQNYDPKRRTSRVRGPVIAKFQAPPGTKIAWFSAGASFVTHQKEAASQTHNAMAYALDKATNFMEIYRAQMPTDQGHWHYNADQEVRLKEPAAALFVRYFGDPGLNNIRLAAHCVDEQPRPGNAVRITHVWTEAGLRRNKTIPLESPASYAIDCAAEPEDESIEIAVPSAAKP